MQDLRIALPSTAEDILAVDLETTGVDPTEPGFAILGIGLADSRGVWYFDWRALTLVTRSYLCQQLRRRPLTAFNVGFDGLVLWWAGLGWLNWSMCSFGLFRQLATEGYDNQRWNLEALERDVLGWKYSNKELLAQLLAKHGLAKDRMGQLADLEPEAFGRYCAEDAEAALQGFEELAAATYNFRDAGAKLRQYHAEDFLNEVMLLCEQQLRGLMVDVPKLERYRTELDQQITTATEEFHNHPEVSPHIKEYNKSVVMSLYDKEPPMSKKDGTVSARWLAWDSKVNTARVTMHFNLGSPQQVSWLFFDRLGYTPVKFTDSGAPSTGKEVLPAFGEPGRLLAAVKKTIKELMYVDATIAKQRKGLLHLQYKSIGALSTRLSAGTEE